MSRLQDAASGRGLGPGEVEAGVLLEDGSAWLAALTLEVLFLTLPFELARLLTLQRQALRCHGQALRGESIRLRATRARHERLSTQ